MLWESINVNSDSYDVYQCTRLFKNAFRIKTTPEVVRTTPKSRKVLGMASQRLFGGDGTPVRANKENSGVICSPLNRSISPRKNMMSKQLKSRCPLEDCDPNSQDSGYGSCYPEKEEKSNDGFQFAEPLGVAPRRILMDNSPLRFSPCHSSLTIPRFRRLSSGYESTDDEFSELIDMETLDGENGCMASDITELLSGRIVSAERPMECDATTPEPPRIGRRSNLGIRRSLSLQNERIDGKVSNEATPPMSRVRSCLFRSPNSTCSAAKLSFDEQPRASPDSPCQNGRPFKRPEPPSDASPVLVKKSKKSTSFQDVTEVSLDSPKAPKQMPLARSLSETDSHAHIKQALHRSLHNNDLTGDFSKACVLPLAEGRHVDLKTISSQTLAALINGEFKNCVNSYTIVDCRYPYEFEAGHIDGAVNLYTKDLIEQFLLEPMKNKPEIQSESDMRRILVFHCEFSWERGPNLSRFLRSIDRQRNKDHYPALHYPEMYLLHGGYEQFFKEHRSLCTPQGYRPMRHPDHEADMRQFRSKSKSWQGEKPRVNNISKSNLKRLGF